MYKIIQKLNLVSFSLISKITFCVYPLCIFETCLQKAEENIINLQSDAKLIFLMYLYS